MTSITYTHSSLIAKLWNRQYLGGMSLTETLAAVFAMFAPVEN
jgi:hypothetical protein